MKNNRCAVCHSFDDSLFSLMDADTMETLNSLKTIVTFKKKHKLFHPDELPDGFYCINRGTIRTYLLEEENSQEFTIKIYYPGEWVGFRDSVLSLAHHSTAECLEDVDACFYPIDAIPVIFGGGEDIQLEILKKIARTCREYEKRMLYLGNKHKHGRLANLLLELHQASPVAPHIELKITRRVIASMIGSTPEFVMRALSDFNSRNWIHIDKKRITILDDNKLKKLSGSIN